MWGSAFEGCVLGGGEADAPGAELGHEIREVGKVARDATTDGDQAFVRVGCTLGLGGGRSELEVVGGQVGVVADDKALLVGGEPEPGHDVAPEPAPGRRASGGIRVSMG